MKSFYLLILISISIVLYGNAQEIKNDNTFSRNNSVQLELGGHGLFYSLNYERFLVNSNRYKVSAQLGLAYYPPASGLIQVWMPIMINHLISFRQHHIELGLGYVATNESNKPYEVKGKLAVGGFYAARVGYRYQQPNKRWLLRVGFTPLCRYNKYEKSLIPTCGLAFGYTF